MTRAIGKLCRWTGARLVCLGMHLSAIGSYLAPRRPVVAWAEPAAWTQAHETRFTGPGPRDWN